MFCLAGTWRSLYDVGFRHHPIQLRARVLILLRIKPEHRDLVALHDMLVVVDKKFNGKV